MPDEGQDLIALTAEIVSAHVANNSVSTGEVAPLIANVFAALSQLGAPADPAAKGAGPQPATTVRRSLSNPGHILSMIDGKPYKVLRRHISQHGYTPESYRQTFGLPGDYPMVAADYAEKRRTLAHAIGLGRKPRNGASSSKASGQAPVERGDQAAEAAPTKQPRRRLKPAFGEVVAAAKDHPSGG